jgi:hypothetical protein
MTSSRIVTLADVRVHLFDGDWNENIGGAGICQLFLSNVVCTGTAPAAFSSIYSTPRVSCFCATDWLVFFNANGSYVYPKAADVDIKASGPCLSNTTFSHVS